MKIEKEKEFSVQIKDLDFGDAFVFAFEKRDDFEYPDDMDVCIKVNVPNPIVYAHEQAELNPSTGLPGDLFYYVHLEDGTFYWTQNTYVYPRTAKAVISTLEK